MKQFRILTFGILLILSLVSNAVLGQNRPVDWVDPLIDTHDSRWFYFSSASRPFGMVNQSPDTKTYGLRMVQF